ncbi:MAG TPA: hypothetical protein VFB67_08425 [Candidatus Polarisedimenticolaceae bacterium]|nr:hypothetical protein [Candidatus Polarisedimenticolaceae bacterium]
MRTTLRTPTAALLALAVVAALTTGCEDSPLTAGADFTMSLVAKPGVVMIDPAQGIDSAQTSIVATVLNANGVPQQGIDVFFSNNGGVLGSANKAVKTNNAGIATDVLTVSSSDAAEIEITATSASLTKTITVTKSTTPVNRPPNPGIAASPQHEQASGKPVVFDGSGSSDPDNDDFITMWKWVITSTNPDDPLNNPIVIEGPGTSGLSFPSDTSPAFVNLQDLTVTLLITDDPDAPNQFEAGQPVAYRAQQTIPYRITAVRCEDNTLPTAVIAGADSQQSFGFAGSTVNFLVDGRLSTDPETQIETYTWNCGNGSIALPQGNGSTAICKYTVDQTPRTYPVTLVVTDRGTGNLVNGAYECAAQSVPDTINVTISPLAGSP